jgi:hypothetical protein
MASQRKAWCGFQVFVNRTPISKNQSAASRLDIGGKDLPGLWVLGAFGDTNH